MTTSFNSLYLGAIYVTGKALGNNTVLIYDVQMIIYNAKHN